MVSYIPIIAGILLALFGLSREKMKIRWIVSGFIIAAAGLYIPDGVLPF